MTKKISRHINITGEMGDYFYRRAYAKCVNSRRFYFHASRDHALKIYFLVRWRKETEGGNESETNDIYNDDHKVENITESCMQVDRQIGSDVSKGTKRTNITECILNQKWKWLDI